MLNRKKNRKDRDIGVWEYGSMGVWEHGSMGEKSQILTSIFPYSCRLIFLDAYKR
jgi:hypothetical protein